MRCKMSNYTLLKTPYWNILNRELKTRLELSQIRHDLYDISLPFGIFQTSQVHQNVHQRCTIRDRRRYVEGDYGLVGRHGGDRKVVSTVSSGTVEIGIFIISPAEKDAGKEIVNCLIAWGRSPWRAIGNTTNYCEP